MKKYFISQFLGFLLVMVVMYITPIYRDYTCVMAGSFVYGIIYFGLVLTERKILIPEKYKDGYLVELSIQFLLMFVSYTLGYWIWTPLMMGFGFHYMWGMILITKWITIDIEKK